MQTTKITMKMAFRSFDMILLPCSLVLLSSFATSADHPALSYGPKVLKYLEKRNCGLPCVKADVVHVGKEIIRKLDIEIQSNVQNAQEKIIDNVKRVEMELGSITEDLKTVTRNGIMDIKGDVEGVGEKIITDLKKDVATTKNEIKENIDDVIAKQNDLKNEMIAMQNDMIAKQNEAQEKIMDLEKNVGEILKILKGPTMQEVAFDHGTVKASANDLGGIYGPQYAFDDSKLWYQSDRGGGFPKLVWYEFTTPLVPARFSMMTRQEYPVMGPTKWKFIGSNGSHGKCTTNSAWTTLCEDLTGRKFSEGERRACDVRKDMKLSFYCLGVKVLDTQWNVDNQDNYPVVALTGIKMWKKNAV